MPSSTRVAVAAARSAGSRTASCSWCTRERARERVDRPGEVVERVGDLQRARSRPAPAPASRPGPARGRCARRGRFAPRPRRRTRPCLARACARARCGPSRGSRGSRRRSARRARRSRGRAPAPPRPAPGPGAAARRRCRERRGELVEHRARGVAQDPHRVGGHDQGRDGQRDHPAGQRVERPREGEAAAGR